MRWSLNILIHSCIRLIDNCRVLRETGLLASRFLDKANNSWGIGLGWGMDNTFAVQVGWRIEPLLFGVTHIWLLALVSAPAWGSLSSWIAMDHLVWVVIVYARTSTAYFASFGHCFRVSISLSLDRFIVFLVLIPVLVKYLFLSLNFRVDHVQLKFFFQDLVCIPVSLNLLDLSDFWLWELSHLF